MSDTIIAMPTYISHKKVQAEKIKAVHFNAFDAIVVFEDDSMPSQQFTKEQLANKPVPEAGMYFVRYEDGYFSFSPAKQFEDGYHLQTEDELAEEELEPGSQLQPGAKFDFPSALDWLRDGKLVAREGWNGKSMFIFLVPGSTFKVNRAPLNVIFPEGTEINYHPHIDMKTADGKIVPWLCSQTDMLASDWQLVDTPQ